MMMPLINSQVTKVVIAVFLSGWNVGQPASSVGSGRVLFLLFFIAAGLIPTFVYASKILHRRKTGLIKQAV